MDADLLHISLILAGLFILLLGLVYCVSRIWLSRYYDSWWDNCMGRDDEDVQRMIERELRKVEMADRDRKEGRGRKRAKSIWLEDLDSNIIDGLKPGLPKIGGQDMDQTEKSVDRYLQAVLQKY